MADAAIALIFAFCLAGLLVAEKADRQAGRWLFKPAASALFVLFALREGALESAYGVAILTALLLCFAGDVLLILKTDRAFLIGMAAFGLGHAAYIGAFSLSGLNPDPFPSLVILAASWFMMKWLWPHLGTFRGPVAGYALIITAMAVAGTAASAAGGDWRIFAGAVIFVASDVAVARDRFVKPAFINRLWGLPAYYAAQFLLASTI